MPGMGRQVDTPALPASLDRYWAGYWVGLQ